MEGEAVPVHKRGTLSEKITWEQTLTKFAVSVRISSQALPKGSGKKLIVDLQPGSIKVGLKRSSGGVTAVPELCGSLYKSIDPSESIWYLDGGELYIELAKDIKYV